MKTIKSGSHSASLPVDINRYRIYGIPSACPAESSFDRLRMTGYTFRMTDFKLRIKELKPYLSNVMVSLSNVMVSLSNVMVSLSNHGSPQTTTPKIPGLPHYSACNPALEGS